MAVLPQILAARISVSHGFNARPIYF